MSFARQLRRSEVKYEKGNNKIRKIWEFEQIRKYGFKAWWNMRVDCDPKHRRASTLTKNA